MKKIFNRLPLYVLAAFSLHSCVKLEQGPFNELSEHKSFLNIEDAQYWVNGMYDGLRENTYGNAMYSTDVQADFLNAVRRNNETLPEIHRWSTFTSSNATTAAIWMAYYKAIQDINIALKGIPNIPIVQERERVERAQIQRNLGELYLGRAYYYTYLVTHFCGAYDESSAYGLPIIKEFKVTDFPAPSSLKETYDFILEDIAQAEELLANTAGTVGSTTFTIDAAKALKARVLLYKGEWATAYATAKALIDAGTYPLATTQTSLAAIWKEDAVTESIVQLFAKAPTSIAGGVSDELPKSNDIYIGANNYDRRLRRFLYNPSFIPTQSFVDLFDTADRRKSIYFTKLFVDYGNTVYRDIYLVTKYPDNNNLKINFSGLPTYMHKPKLLRVAELYLIAAEAAYKNGDETNAKTYLNALRTARISGATSITATGTALFTEIQNERNRELAFEGFRLYDIKRWNLGVVRGTPQNVAAIFSTPADEYYQLNISAGNYKLTWPIPAADISFEKGKWQQNPGW